MRDRGGKGEGGREGKEGVKEGGRRRKEGEGEEEGGRGRKREEGEGGERTEGGGKEEERRKELVQNVGISSTWCNHPHTCRENGCAKSTLTDPIF